MSLELGYFFVLRSDEIFASPTGVVHPVHCLTRRYVALYRGGQRLASLQWHQATSIVVRAIRVTMRNKGGLSCAHVATPAGRILG